MTIIKNIIRSTLIATTFFWLIIYKYVGDGAILVYIFLSLLPIFLSCLVTILITIYPFYWIISNDTRTNSYIFKTYFPYYAIVSFCGSMLAIIASNFELFVIGFFASAFITTSHSWMWFSKE
ncbi:hypothetical protein [Lacinutrix sp. Hel_I_90]|uniref:hypothetical protein n=1 Tax=Lacinutrix sp. Hel_I_90 TaxID=1249999 RepID=UPI0005CB5CCD|nr:hypothetical protein [Lacinutrix sp. Hel_I_90]